MIDVVIGQNTIVGEVDITTEMVYVTINQNDLKDQLNATARINTIHFETGNQIEDFQKGNGLFSLTDDVVAINEWSYELPLKKFSEDATMFVAHFEFGYDANYDLLQDWLNK